MVILYCLHTWRQVIIQQIFVSFHYNGSRVFSSFTQSTNRFLNNILTVGEESRDTIILSTKVEIHQTSDDESKNYPVKYYRPLNK